MASSPNLDYLRECFSYDPETGSLKWKARPLHHFKDSIAQRSWNSRHAGETTGMLQSNGKSRIHVNGQIFAAHGIIWAMQTGAWPTVVEHKNGDLSDNRWENLRRPQDHVNPRNKWSNPDAAFLHECFSYDPAVGVLIWKRRPLGHFKRASTHKGWNARHAGKPAGLPNRDGHIRILVNSGQFTAHRLIWVMQTGEWPKVVDHINGDPADNRWENLREATSQENQWNRRRAGELPKGVMKARSGPNFWARATFIKEDGTRSIKHLGTFSTPEEAHAAWRAFVERDRGEFFRAD